ncbi:hypothetical protein Ddye_002879 [Dipteronia dyeriana]|uniref:Uncharacterized protein n=1 Tax=Dipteronia dyeriana TaxID=168575 RepID=A0AAD9XRM7_9ROSI|nr:hypothetical protein Ddye_002879 [Dipteronia dyeriana]
MACTLFVIDTEATSIGYGAIGRDGIPCDPNDRANCKTGPPANNYQRGVRFGYVSEGSAEQGQVAEAAAEQSSVEGKEKVMESPT